MTKSDAPSVFDMLRKSDLAGKGSQTPSSLLSGSGDGVFANSPATSTRIPIRGGVLDPLINGSPASMRAEMFHAGSMDAVMGVNGSMGAGRLHYPASSASSSISALPQQGPVYLQNQPYGVPGGRPVAYFPQDVGRIGHGPIGGYANVSFPQPFVNDPAIAGYHGMGSPYTTPGFQRGPHDFHGPHRANTVSLGDPTNSTTSSVSNFQQGAFGGRRSPSPPQQAGLTGGLGGEVYEGAIGATTTNNAIGRMSGIPDIESVASPGGQPSTATLSIQNRPLLRYQTRCSRQHPQSAPFQNTLLWSHRLNWYLNRRRPHKQRLQMYQRRRSPRLRKPVPPPHYGSQQTLRLSTRPQALLQKMPLLPPVSLPMLRRKLQRSP
ncbi:hypothetical protein FRC15_007973 [Serendipita sp. 397]|nr:hypothetical protein FRC15_007973 [Serendipita sp. 397]